MADPAALVAAAQAELERRILDEDERRKVPMPVLIRIIERYSGETPLAGVIVDPVEWARSLGVPADRQRDLLAARIGVTAEEAATLIRLASHDDEEGDGGNGET
jgi:hypothetical protein